MRKIDWWIHTKDKADPDSYRKAKFFLWSFFIFAFFCVASEPYMILAGFPEDAIWGNAFFSAILICGLFAYRKFGGRVLWVNITSALGFMSNIGTYQFSGGIYSGDLFSGIIICAWIYLVSNRLYGLIWFGITLFNICFFLLRRIVRV